ncbi:alpha/beta hydrolase family protein [Sorangium sp. So ce1389]|uniref:alpha/beta hydrolase family protein n=1 Tax=Sorangium sp. So ce1389 TaxID=3133336 RepID=UPI003F62018B
MNILRTSVLTLFGVALLASPRASHADTPYRHAPDEIRAILDAPIPPSPFVSPTGGHVLQARALHYPPVSDLAEPMLPLAGVRFNPRNNGRHGARYFVGLTLKKLPDGAEVPVALPAGARLDSIRWNATGTLVAFVNQTATTVELWVLDVATAKAKKLPGVRVNPVLGYTFAWMPDQKTLLVKTVPAGRKAPPEPPRAPSGPYIEETSKVTTASSTYEAHDLLKTPYDGDRFEYYTTAQLALVQSGSGRVTNVGRPAVFVGVQASTDGRYLLVEQVKRPYSYLRPYYRFPTSVDVWDTRGKQVEQIADLPLAEQVPIHGERTGPRAYRWRPTEPATLLWAEALDGGDSYKKVPFHDKIVIKPVAGAARELIKTKQRFAAFDWIEGGSRALVSEYDRDTHRMTTALIDVDDAKVAPRPVWDRSADDRYGDPGSPVYRMLPNGSYVVRVHDGAIHLSAMGATPAGNRPFLDRLDLKTLKTERLFRAGPDALEYFLTWLDPAAGTFLTRRESPTDPPNLFVRTLGGAAAGTVAAGEPARTSTSRAITRFADPTPQLRKISKQLVTYKRADGLPLSFTLYLPPGYQKGTRLPTIVWAYPLDYTERSAAGQVEATPNKFTMIFGASPLFLALAGYAVLDQTAMPVVGPSETLYDTFIEQITANAKAAIDKAVELGVTDPDRIAVTGHSHGALMTANLLAWTDLFRTGIARSGAYNHTLVPFGFQKERRTLYKARETYLKLSPLLNADKINEPLLLIHGEVDVNPGTATMQSQQLYEAIRGVGGIARLLILPHESHGYLARESTEHVIAEMVTWFDRHVKNAPPRKPAWCRQSYTAE